MLALDPLLNFSKTYLHAQSGGQMDAPLFIIPAMNPSEVDKEAHNVDVNSSYRPSSTSYAPRGRAADNTAHS
jgi:DNA polymerase II large subunit